MGADMSKGVFEDMSEALERVERKVDALVAGGAAGVSEPRMLTFASLAKRYDVAHNTVRELLHRMAAAGFAVETCRVGQVWRVNVAQFDEAFDRLFGEAFVKSLC